MVRPTDARLKMPTAVPKKMYCDNKAVVSIAHNPDRMKHVEVDISLKKKLTVGVCA